MARYRQLHDGEPRRLRISKDGVIAQRLRCCDCALVHKVGIEITGPRSAVFYAWRDVRATAAARRRKNGK